MFPCLLGTCHLSVSLKNVFCSRKRPAAGFHYDADDGPHSEVKSLAYMLSHSSAGWALTSLSSGEWPQEHLRQNAVWLNGSFFVPFKWSNFESCFCFIGILTTGLTITNFEYFVKNYKIEYRERNRWRTFVQYNNSNDMVRFCLYITPSSYIKYNHKWHFNFK